MFTATGLEGRSYSEVRTDLGLVIGTNVQAYSADNAFRTDKLSAFAATTSAELADTISDETGEGAFVLGTSPTLSNVHTDIWLSQDSNTFFGVDVAGDGNLAHVAGDTGYQNVAIGNNCLKAITTGYQNVAIGADSAYKLQDARTNFALGKNALHENISGDHNIGIGYNAGYATTGGYNTFIGTYAGDSCTAGNNNICIGYNADITVAGATYELNIGGTLYGNLNLDYIGINTATPSGTLDVNEPTDSDPHILLSENNATKWDIYNDHTTDALEVYSGATRRYSFGADGTAIADVAWNTFSPKITATGRDLLAVALEDANKPVKPYEGIPVKKADNELFDMIPTEYQEEINKVDEEGNPVLDEDGKPVKEIVTKIKDEKVFRERRPNEFATKEEVQAEFDKYAKCPAKITIANARYLEYLTGVIDTMQAKIDELEARIEKLEQKEAMK